MTHDYELTFTFTQGTSNLGKFRAVRIVEFPATPAAFNACPSWLEWGDDASSDFVLRFIDGLSGHAVEDFAKTCSAIAVRAAFFHVFILRTRADNLFERS